MLRRIAFLTAAEGVEEVELREPWQAVLGAGHTAELLSTDEGDVQLFRHLDRSSTQRIDRRVRDVAVADYDALVLPGGVANPDALRMDEVAVSFVRDFVASGKPVAAICHAAWTLVEADSVRDRRLTSWPSLRTDITNAGGTWLDDQVVVDGNLITSRKPDDLPAFIKSILVALGLRAPPRASAPAASRPPRGARRGAGRRRRPDPP